MYWIENMSNFEEFCLDCIAIILEHDRRMGGGMIK